jgi:hypothetical protein
MEHLYTIQVKLRPENVYPDLFDWLEQRSIEYGKDWVWSSTHWSSTHSEFMFVKSEHATLFALRWA